MQILQDDFDKSLAELAASATTEAELEAIAASAPQMLNEVLNTVPKATLESIKLDAYKGGLDKKRQTHLNFIARNYKRWKDGFDALELLIEICIEAGANFNRNSRTAADKSSEILFDTLSRLHAKGCLIAKEIACLLTNGFADGAHARWRALHEVTVTSKFLAEKGTDTTERYIAHQHVDSYKGACQHKAYEARLQAVAPTEEIIASLKAKYDEAISRYGNEFANSYGWAGHALGKKKVNFADIEKAVSFDHWRPYYKWASQNIHASAKTIRFSLGTTETDADLLLVGSSDAGMTDPAHSMAISLSQITVNLLSISPNLDNLVTMKMIIALSDEIGELFLKAQKQAPL
ncbi:DUF5677 domain-containing protein [Pseudomonas asiatica]|jgi:hypothetical protein|uniref:DUF5677 domain-containing protein n=1 Tax=Pseudomonas asiatica TaxID=2219225 RepID=UPI0021F7294B|nr:DUF5677 domain-containing protein [Pseudomonas asiatica]UYP84235.1 DUF5677 domain-containing protein [Pseudomonas asiatica]